MFKLQQLFELFMYDSSPGERLRVARLFYRLGVLFFVLWGVGALSAFGVSGFAKAQDVDRKIQEAVGPIKEQLEDIRSNELVALKTKLENGERMQKRILAAQISSQLRDLNRLRCSTKDTTVRSRMEQDIEQAEQEYRQLTGERYPLPACKDL